MRGSKPPAACSAAVRSSTAAPLPDYAAQDPLVVHLAFDVGGEDIIAVRVKKLISHTLALKQYLDVFRLFGGRDTMKLMVTME